MPRVLIEEGPQNYQILQQKNGFAEINLKGTVEIPKEADGMSPRIIITLLDENSGTNMVPPVIAKHDKGHWQASFSAPVGGPYTLRTALRYGERDCLNGDMVSHIGVGDLYLIAGQSNAEGNGKNSVYDPISDNVHMFKLSGKWDIATHPLNDNTDSKYSRYTAFGYHSPWIQFAKILKEHLGYPIGLIPTAQGGVPLSYWNKAENGELFYDMMDIVNNAGGSIKGVLWYQGCSDCSCESNRNTYLERFKKVCEDIRNALGSRVPFLTVQLNKTTYFGSQDREVIAENWAVVREAQRKATIEAEAVYLIPSIDLTVCDTIHNTSFSNLVIAERVANTALHYIYGKSILCDAPDIECAYLKNSNTVCLKFKNVYDAIITDYYFSDALPFQVFDKSGKNNIADYTCPGDNTILLYFDREIVLPATVGCTKYSESGFMPYDMLTRLPIIPFNNIEIEKGF